MKKPKAAALERGEGRALVSQEKEGTDSAHFPPGSDPQGTPQGSRKVGAFWYCVLVIPKLTWPARRWWPLLLWEILG